jgi:putative endonuclease
MGVAKHRGAAGESLAAEYLSLIGWDVHERNVRLAGVEIDLLARDDRTDVLVEVKVRCRDDYGGAAYAVDRRKRERMQRAARALLHAGARIVRIDVVTVELEADGVRLRHYRNAITD